MSYNEEKVKQSAQGFCDVAKEYYKNLIFNILPLFKNKMLKITNEEKKSK